MLCTEGSVSVEVTCGSSKVHQRLMGECHVSDTETDIELFGANSTRRVWRKKNIPTVKSGGGNTMLWDDCTVLKRG